MESLSIELLLLSLLFLIFNLFFNFLFLCFLFFNFLFFNFLFFNFLFFNFLFFNFLFSSLEVLDLLISVDVFSSSLSEDCSLTSLLSLLLCKLRLGSFDERLDVLFDE